MSRLFLIVALCLAWGWNSAAAQPRSAKAKRGDAARSVTSGKTDKLVRVAYPVADLVIPIENHSAFKPDKAQDRNANTTDALAQSLVTLITQSVAKNTWATHGGQGRIQYFPMGMAIVVHQPQDVQDAIARLLGDLRKLQDVQVSIELKLVSTSRKAADKILTAMDADGLPVRALEIHKAAPVGRFVALDEKQAQNLVRSAQGDVTQCPKMTLFNNQQAGLNLPNMRCDVQPVVDNDGKTVHVTVDLELRHDAEKPTNNLRTAGIFTLTSDRTLVWNLGEFAGQHRLVLMTPRAILVKKEAKLQNENAAWGLSVSGPKNTEVSRAVPAPVPVPTGFFRDDVANSNGEIPSLVTGGAIPFQLKDPKERAIEYRLRQPISLTLKDRPLNEAVREISSISGIQLVLDEGALKNARINLEAPLNINVEDIDMKFALNILLKPLHLTYVIEDQVLKITTMAEKLEPLLRKTYPIGDLLIDMQEHPLPDSISPVKSLDRTITKTWLYPNACPPAAPAFNPGMVFGSNESQVRATDPFAPSGHGLTTPPKTKRSEDDMAKLLMNLIRNSYDKNSWEEMGGTGSIQYLPREKSLVINQRGEVHEEIAQLFTSMRRLQGIPVNVQFRLVQASAETAWQWRKSVKDFDNSTFGLDDRQCQQLLEIAKRDSVTTIVQVPTLNVFDGKTMPLEFTRKVQSVTELKLPSSAVTQEKQSEKIFGGWRCELKPVVSPDRRFVRTTVSIEHFTNDEAKSVVHSLKASKEFNIANGCTFVWDLGEIAGTRQHLFVLVTPRIQARQEEERLFMGEIVPIPGR